MSLYQCENCSNFCSLPESFYNKLDEKCHEKGFYQAIVKCECGNKTIEGGSFEHDGIYMYGECYNNEENIDLFSSEMLIECDENEAEFTTIEGSIYQQNARTIYLKKK